MSTSNHQLAFNLSVCVSYLFDPVGGTLSRHASLPTQRHQLLSRAPLSSSLSSAPQTDDSYTLYTPNNPHLALPHAIGLSANPGIYTLTLIHALRGQTHIETGIQYSAP